MKMKKILPFFMALFIVASAMTSCKKDKDDDPKLEKCKVTRLAIEYQENYEGEEYGYTDNIVLNYDSQGRLTGWSEDGDGFSISLQYDNNGRLIRFDFMEDGETGEYGLVTWGTNEATITYYYDIGSGTPEISSWRTVMKFNQSGQIIRMDELYNNGSSWELRYYVLNTWQNDNVIKQEQFERDDYWKSSPVSKNHTSLRSWYQNRREDRARREAHTLKAAPQDMVLYSTATYTYDNKKNSFAVQTGMHLLVEGFPAFMSKNNILTVTEQYYDESPRSYSFSYTYNDDDYPLTRSVTAVSSWGQWSETWTFTYDCN